MKKRLLSLIMAVMMVVVLVVPAAAATTDTTSGGTVTVYVTYGMLPRVAMTRLRRLPRLRSTTAPACPPRTKSTATLAKSTV